MIENLAQIIEELCFQAGSGYPEKTEENYADGEWFNLVCYDFKLVIGKPHISNLEFEIELETIGNLEGPAVNKVSYIMGYSRTIVYQDRTNYFEDEEGEEYRKLNIEEYHSGEWEKAVLKRYKQYRRDLPTKGEQKEFDFTRFKFAKETGEQMDFAEISGEFYF
ncbi:hypothetical protein J4463_02835 [Candidatus Pacearchaeota archaeon]|nr:hypothetical protein [Candidatus Pacearchaeota archaeon]